MISCDNYDYIEIACLYKLQVELTLKGNKLVEGIAKDTARDEAREECLLLGQHQGDVLVVLSTIKQMRAINANPHFDIVTFQ